MHEATMSDNTSSPVTRRLAVIVIADVVGYTRLMEGDDTGTCASAYD
jgi:class 3 adenylate cyclase